jgi:hypothetical protein
MVTVCPLLMVFCERLSRSRPRPGAANRNMGDPAPTANRGLSSPQVHQVMVIIMTPDWPRCRAARRPPRALTSAA